MSSIKEFIEKCQEMYYEGNPIITNEEYDALVSRFPEYEESIGAEGDIPHMYRMYSLQKFYPSRGDKLPSLDTECIKTPKLDGCAIDLLYINGEFSQALTRGNGIKGKDVTSNVKFLNIPMQISHSGVLQVVGEVLVTKEVENLRNYASGAVNLNNSVEFCSRVTDGGLVFVAYSVQESTQYIGVTDTYKEDMKLLEYSGFVSALSAEDKYNYFPTDGEVYRVNNNKQFQELGWTNKFPKAAFAVKEDEEGVVTTLEKVEWSTGALGRVTPVGHFTPIVIDGATISKATLNNVEYINALELTLGCKILVIRAGGVIPKIIEKVRE